MTTDSRHYLRDDRWRKIGVVIASLLPVVLLGCVSALADTLTLTAIDGLEVRYNSDDSADRHGSYELALVSSDETFALRDPSDPVFYEYLLQGQASADADCLIACIHGARVVGDVGFSFVLPDTVSLWDIGVDYEYHGVVVVRGAFGAICDDAWARAVRPIGTGVVSSLGTTSIPGATVQYEQRARLFDGQRSEQVTGVFGVNAPGKVSFNIDLWAQSDKDIGGCGGGEAYSSLGQLSGLGSFSVDNDYYDPQDGLQVRLTFTPHLNLSGHTIESDLVLAEGETLSGFGTVGK